MSLYHYVAGRFLGRFLSLSNQVSSVFDRVLAKSQVLRLDLQVKLRFFRSQTSFLIGKRAFNMHLQVINLRISTYQIVQ